MTIKFKGYLNNDGQLKKINNRMDRLSVCFFDYFISFNKKYKIIDL